MLNFNIYARAGISSAINAKNNRKVADIVKTASEVDCLTDFDSFRNFIKNCKRDVLSSGVPFGTKGIATEPLFYGHNNALLAYAGEPSTPSSRLLLPYIEHGIAWLQKVPGNAMQSYVHCTVSQGAYRFRALREARPWMPHYVIGPYVYYAKPYYSAKKEAELRRQMGRTLLVFPAHTYENSSLEYGKKQFVESIMERFADEFDTIMVSAYWHDVDDEVFQFFEDVGAVVVSAGLREDPCFISRLRTMIELSDVVVGNALGTHIGYALCLGKPFIMTDDSRVSINDDGDDYHQNEIDSLDKVRAWARTVFAPGAPRDPQDIFFEKYWGGRKAIKSPEEIRCLLGISRDVLDLSRGFVDRFPSAVHSIFREACSGGGTDSAMREHLLREALNDNE